MWRVAGIVFVTRAKTGPSGYTGLEALRYGLEQDGYDLGARGCPGELDDEDEGGGACEGERGEGEDDEDEEEDRKGDEGKREYVGEGVDGDGEGGDEGQDEGATCLVEDEEE